MDQQSVDEFVEAAYNNHISKVKRMIAATPAIVDEQDSTDCNTALIKSCMTGRTKIVEHLLKETADVNMQNKEGETALMRASMRNFSPVAKMLLDAGADCNLQSDIGWTALMYAASKGHLSTVELLLQRGANTNVKTEEGINSLLCASGEGETTIVQLLLQYGAEVNDKDKLGNTPLMIAALGGHSATVQALLDMGADINLQNKDGETALMKASCGGLFFMVELLLKNGADVAIKNKVNKTALDLSINNIGIRQLLKHAAKMLDEPADDNTPSHVIKAGDVEVIDHIKHTGFSSVYRGKYRSTNVIIKMLRSNAERKLSVADLQQSEIVLLSKLRHPRILSLMGVIFDLEDRYEATAGLVTEFMPRGSLYDVLHLDTTPPEHRLITLSSKLRVLRDVADGMRFLHMSNVIHRDLKSPNVLLDEDGRAKICDFGVSKQLSTNTTHATAGAGTPAWQAPESMLEDVDVVRQSSDVYSFGVILWEMLTSKIPWEGVDPFKIPLRLARGESLPLSEVTCNALMPPDVVEMLQQCLKHEANCRPTFEAILQCLFDQLTACIEREGRVPCPAAFQCPISHDIMEDPVICSDGFTFDRVHIERWLEHNNRSPITNAKLEDKILRPNIVLRGMIQEFKEANPQIF